jgi:FkbM family methyltransferase
MPESSVTSSTSLEPSPSLSERARDASRRVEESIQAGRWSEALATSDEVLALCPNDGDALLKRFQILRRLGRLDEALACIWRAVDNKDRPTSLWTDAATALIEANRLVEAQSVAQTALRHDPFLGWAWMLLGEVLSKQGKDIAAESCFRGGTKLSPGHGPSCLRLAQWLTQAGQFDEAIHMFLAAEAAGFHSLDAISGRAQALITLARLDEAAPLLQQVQGSNAEHLDAQLGIARIALLKGDMATGWPAYEWRRRRADIKLPKLAGPEWDGSPICGKTLVVYAEQGFGDVIQFSRYIPLLAAEGARVVFLVPKELEQLFQCLTMYAEVLCSLRPLPAYDFHVPLLSVPRFISTSLDTIPAEVPYLKVERSDAPQFPVPLGTRLKVGVAWAGRPTHANDRYRSASVETFLPLASVPGVTLYSLQVGPHAGDIDKIAHSALIENMSPRLKDFSDTAAVIEQLDLVICVDTSVAHLAGALGKPVWVLVPYAPDWRWMLERNDTPWYPTMRLFRQTKFADWNDVVERIVGELRVWSASRTGSETEGECWINAIFPDASGQPRYRMVAPHGLLTDEGIRFLANRERKGVGYEYATRSFLDAHLRPGDLFIDVGAHWGIMSLHAATRWPDKIAVLACEPTPRNQPHLRRWIDENGLSQSVEVIPSAISDVPGRGNMLPQSTMGHSLIKVVDGAVGVTTIDALLAERTHLADRRVVVKIDVEGGEANVIDGMTELLSTGRVAAIIWERGRAPDEAEGRRRVERIRSRLGTLGYTAWRFNSEDVAGTLIPFVDDGRIDNVFELAPGIAPLPSYGDPRPVPSSQPSDIVLDSSERALELFHVGLRTQSAGHVNKALGAYAQSAGLDRRNPDLFNNLGVALQRLGRLPAAEACYRCSLALRPGDAGCLSNLGSVLRELGKLEEAKQAHDRALAAAPGNARLIVNACHALRDLGRPAEAQVFFEEVLKLEPENPDVQQDFALSLLQQGNYRQGFAAYAACRSRKNHTRPPVTSRQWAGEPLAGQSILVLDDGDLEDALLLIRFAPDIVQQGAGKIVVYCRHALMSLFAAVSGVDAVVDRDSETPACDCFVSLLSLPAIFEVTAETLRPQPPYLSSRQSDLPLPSDGRLKLGLIWATATSGNRFNCPLSQLLPHLDAPRFALFSLQQGSNATDLKATGAEAFIRDLGPRLQDFLEIGATMKELDLLVAIDSPLAHLAGALGIPTFLLLPYSTDWRWRGRTKDSLWYPTVRLFRQTQPNDWDGALAELTDALGEFSEKKYVECTRENASMPGAPNEKPRKGLACGALD